MYIFIFLLLWWKVLLRIFWANIFIDSRHNSCKWFRRYLFYIVYTGFQISGKGCGEWDNWVGENTFLWVYGWRILWGRNRIVPIGISLGRRILIITRRISLFFPICRLNCEPLRQIRPYLVIPQNRDKFGRKLRKEMWLIPESKNMFCLGCVTCINHLLGERESII